MLTSTVGKSVETIMMSHATNDKSCFYINWLMLVLFAIIILLMIVVSFFTSPKDATAIQGLYFGSASAEQRAVTRASWDKWDVINSVIIITFVIAFYIYFW